MSRGLPGPVRKYLDAMDARIEGLSEDDRAALAEQALVTLSLYQGLSRVALARLVMESVVAMDACLVRASKGGNLEEEIRSAMFNSAALCAVLTRRERGRSPL